MENYESLIKNIRKNIRNFPAKNKGENDFGTKYEIIMELMGENGKTANVLTAWIYDKEIGEMRLINAYIDRKKGIGVNR